LDEVTFEGTAGGDQVFPFNYKTSFMYEFGVTRQLPKGMFASAGYIYSENSSPSRDFNPIVPDSVLHLGSVGFGYRGARWGMALAYHFAYNSGRRINNSQAASLIGQTANGDYEVFNQAITLSGRINF
jgi:long-subunit fatty acid transport protein